MKILKTLQYGLLSSISIFSLASCKKTPYIQVTEVPESIVKRVDSLRNSRQYILNDNAYYKYGTDTVQILQKKSIKFDEFIKSLDKKAVRKTPKTKVGSHMETLILPKSGGGFDYIPTIKDDFEPDYKNQKAVINSDKIFTKNGEDLYIPVEYYGQKSDN